MEITWERIVETRKAHRRARADLRKSYRSGETIPAELVENFMAATDATDKLFRDFLGWYNRPQFPGEVL